MGAMRRVLAAVAYCGSVRALHASLAYPSILSLPSLPVKQVCIDCQNPEDDPTAWNAKIRSRAAQRGFGHRKGTATVVFASDPSQADLAVLCGNDGTVRQLEDTVLEPGDRNDWPVYDRLLLSDLSRHLRNRGVEKDYGSLWLPLAGETFPALDHVIKRGIHIGLTTFVDTGGECRLLMSLGVKHKIVANESLYSMLKRESFDNLRERNFKVQTRPGIYPSYRGTLCDDATTQGSISAPRAELNKQSLIEYSNSKGDKRCVYLETEPDPDAVAVGLKYDGRPVMDYPPQLLEPAFDNELPLTARRYMKLSPGDWVEKTTSIKGLVTNWCPGFLNLTQPFLWGGFLRAESGGNTVTEAVSGYLEGLTERNLIRYGPELPTKCSAELLPIYPAKDADKVNRLVNNLRNRCFQKWTPSIRVAPREKWIIFDDEGAWEDELRALGGKSQASFVLACLDADSDYMKIKDSAARSNFASQCVELPKLKDWATNNIFLGINAKLGGQAELCDDLAEPGTVFVSYDVSRQRSIGLSVDAMLLGNDGRMISGQDDSCYQKGEILDAEFLEKSLQRCVRIYEQQYGTPVRRVVVYRDGRFLENEQKICLETLAGYVVDLVELTKSGPDCHRFINFDTKTKESSQPRPGFFVTLRERMANLVTSSAAKIPGGLARPLVVSHVHGDATFDQILTEVYKTTAIRTYCDRPTRLPAHSHYADRRAGAELVARGETYPSIPGLHAA